MILEQSQVVYKWNILHETVTHNSLKVFETQQNFKVTNRSNFQDGGQKTLDERRR